MTESFTEPGGGVRLMGYQRLQSVSFNGEPVVPIIIAKPGKNHVGDFGVEQLGGFDLTFAIQMKDISVLKKLKILDLVAGQFQAIDKVGLVLLDRVDHNIRVIPNGDSFSIRQLDLEVFYDKKSKMLHSDSEWNKNRYQEIVDEKFKNGYGYWYEAVSGLGVNMFIVLKNFGSDKEQKSIPIAEKYMADYLWEEKDFRRDLLACFRRDLLNVTRSVS